MKLFFKLFTKSRHIESINLLTFGTVHFIFGIAILLILRLDSQTSKIFDQTCVATLISFLLIPLVRLVVKKDNKILRKFLKESITTGMIASLLVFIFGTLFLMNIDRSKSFYVLIWCDQPRNFKSITKLSFEQLGGIEYGGLQMRLNEQMSRGLIARTGKTYHLTNEGKLVLNSADSLASIFKLSGFKAIEKETKSASL